MPKKIDHKAEMASRLSEDAYRLMIVLRQLRPNALLTKMTLIMFQVRDYDTAIKFLMRNV